MGRNVSVDTSLSASVAVSNINNPVSGIFGTGKVRIFPKSAVFTVPEGITSIRARLWGGGQSGGYGYYTPGGNGGGFALKTINGLTPGQTIAITVATSDGTSSVGSYVSASTIGVGGDLNTSGGSRGTGAFSGGGGAGSIFGNGGEGGNGLYSGASVSPTTIGSGGGGGTDQFGASGLSGGVNPVGGISSTPNYGYVTSFYGTAVSNFTSIDFIGTGSGGSGVLVTDAGTRNVSYSTSGVNGGGGGSGGTNKPGGSGGFPGGGGGSSQISPGIGAPGLVIVEW